MRPETRAHHHTSSLVHPKAIHFLLDPPPPVLPKLHATFLPRWTVKEGAVVGGDVRLGIVLFVEGEELPRAVLRQMCEARGSEEVSWLLRVSASMTANSPVDMWCRSCARPVERVRTRSYQADTVIW
jgi:hypothetical protein